MPRKIVRSAESKNGAYRVQSSMTTDDATDGSSRTATNAAPSAPSVIPAAHWRDLAPSARFGVGLAALVVSVLVGGVVASASGNGAASTTSSETTSGGGASARGQLYSYGLREATTPGTVANLNGCYAAYTDYKIQIQTGTSQASPADLEDWRAGCEAGRGQSASFDSSQTYSSRSDAPGTSDAGLAADAVALATEEDQAAEKNETAKEDARRAAIRENDRACYPLIEKYFDGQPVFLPDIDATVPKQYRAKMTACYKAGYTQWIPKEYWESNQ